MILREGPSKDSASARRDFQAQQAVVQEIPAQAFELPAVKTLELLRSTPIHDLEACAIKGFCSRTLADRLGDFSSHRGAVELIDSLSANFCLKSPFSSQISFCRTHHFAGIEPDMLDHQDSEYKNLEVMYCMLEMPKCDPEIREHLDSLLHDKPTVQSMSAILRYVCRTRKVEYWKDLLSCKVEKIKPK